MAYVCVCYERCMLIVQVKKLSLSLKSSKKKEEALFHLIMGKDTVALAKEQKGSKAFKNTTCVSSLVDGKQAQAFWKLLQACYVLFHR